MFLKTFSILPRGEIFVHCELKLGEEVVKGIVVASSQVPMLPGLQFPFEKINPSGQSWIVKIFSFKQTIKL
jgi:hypothetical protein